MKQYFNDKLNNFENYIKNLLTNNIFRPSGYNWKKNFNSFCSVIIITQAMTSQLCLIIHLKYCKKTTTEIYDDTAIDHLQYMKGKTKFFLPSARNNK